MGAATDLPPDGRVERARAVPFDLRAPDRLLVSDEVHFQDGAAAAGAYHRRLPWISIFVQDVKGFRGNEAWHAPLSNHAAIGAA